MANPTTNYGFVLPTATDLVTDLPADFDVALQGVDTQMKTNADAATQKATLTTKGDIYAATGTSTPARLAVGANNTVLTADSTTATGLKWAIPSSGANWTLVNTGGTSLTGAATVTVSGISNADKIMVLFQGAVSAANAFSIIAVRLNGDTAANYRFYGEEMVFPTTYAKTISSSRDGSTENRINVFAISSSAASTGNGYCLISGANSSGVKMFQAAGAGNAGSGDQQVSYNLGGFYNSASVITSVSAFSTDGNFDGGTLFVYTSA
jgi:hypothetical protein